MLKRENTFLEKATETSQKIVGIVSERHGTDIPLLTDLMIVDQHKDQRLVVLYH